MSDIMFDYRATYYKVLDDCYEYKEGDTPERPLCKLGDFWLGGIEFTSKPNLHKFYNIHGSKIAEVKIPLGTQVYHSVNGDYWKAAQILIVRCLSVAEIDDLGLLNKNQKNYACVRRKN